MARSKTSNGVPLNLQKTPAPILKLLCEGIVHAHLHSPDKWGLTEFVDRLRFNVGFSEVVTVDQYETRLFVNRSLIPLRLPMGITIDFGHDKRGIYPSSPGSVLIEIPMTMRRQSLSRVLRALRPAFFENIRIAGRGGRGKGVQNGHSNSFVCKVAEVAKVSLPFPDYASSQPLWRHDELVVIEGEIVRAVVNRRRRSRGIVEAKIRDVQRIRGRILCEACNMDPVQRYGEGVALLCEVHHRTAISTAIDLVTTRLADLAILCPTCHRAIHLRDPMPNVEAFRDELQGLRGQLQPKHLP